MRCQSSLIDHLIANTHRLGVPISPGSSNMMICVRPNYWIISWMTCCKNCYHGIWVGGDWRLIWKSPNVFHAIWSCRCSPCCTIILQQILTQHWQWQFSCTLHDILLVCPCLCWYSIAGQCLLNFSFALVNGRFPPASCTPQNEWFKRARSFLDVCACVWASPQKY